MSSKHTRTTIFLTEHQKKAFTSLSEAVNLSVSELMRRAYDHFLHEETLNQQFPTFSGFLDIRSH
jgi:hypothetical protein